jgi:uncharacterized protein YidB (DUF937 family)
MTMGLLDSLGAMWGGAQGQGGQDGQGGSAELIPAVIAMLAQANAGAGAGAGGATGGGGGAGGGLAGLVAAFQANGLGEVANSWVGTGQNLPVSGDQLGQVLGQQQMSDLASRFGLPTGDLGTQLSQSLPRAVDHLTPNGQLPQGGLGGLGDLLARLTRR